MWRFVLVLSALLVTSSLTAAGEMETGFLNRTLVVDSEDHRYQVYVPHAYTPDHSWPVILFLHGSGERGTDGLLQTEIGLGAALRRYSERYPALVVFPQAAPDTRWPGAMAAMALQALDQTVREFNADPKRIYLTGISMGGNGAWYLAYRYPTRFAALLVACGYVLPDPRRPTVEPVVPEADGPALAALSQRLRDLPIWIFHGAADDVVPVDNSRQIVTALRETGAPVTYTELTGAGHNAWDAAYGSPEVAAWLLSQRRPAR